MRISFRSIALATDRSSFNISETASLLFIACSLMAVLMIFRREQFSVCIRAKMTNFLTARDQLSPQKVEKCGFSQQDLVL
jgi:hypothetical protein